MKDSSNGMQKLARNVDFLGFQGKNRSGNEDIRQKIVTPKLY
jgi:hypothetical protein